MVKEKRRQYSGEMIGLSTSKVMKLDGRFWPGKVYREHRSGTLGGREFQEKKCEYR